MLKIIGRELNNIVKVNDEVNNLLLIRFTIIKETPNHFICRDSHNRKYKLIKSEETQRLRVGDDTTQYIRKVGRSLFTDTIVLLTKKEEYELTVQQSKTLKDLGLTIDDVCEKRHMS